MAIEWDDALVTGDEEVDGQHRVLFAEVTHFLDACQQGRGTEAVHRIMDFLENYITTHFDTEERLQKKYAYPDHFTHMARHREFRQDFSDLKGHFATEGATIRFMILASYVINDWLERHIKTMDKPFSQFMRKMTEKETE